MRNAMAPEFDGNWGTGVSEWERCVPQVPMFPLPCVGNSVKQKNIQLWIDVLKIVSFSKKEVKQKHFYTMFSANKMLDKAY